MGWAAVLCCAGALHVRARSACALLKFFKRKFIHAFVYAFIRAFVHAFIHAFVWRSFFLLPERRFVR